MNKSADYTWLLPIGALVGFYLMGRRNRQMGALSDGADLAAGTDLAAGPVETAVVAPTSAIGKWFRFGAIDNGVLVVSALAGFSLDDVIAKAIGVKGWGSLVGATVGNALSDGVAALPEGRGPALGVTAGALAPLVPIVVAMALKKPPKGQTAVVLGATSAAFVLWAFLKGRKAAKAAA